MARVCPNLTEISGKHIDTEGLRALGRLSGSSITSISFDAIDTSGSTSLDNAIDVFCKGSPNLKKLWLPDPSGPITDAAVLSIVQHCPHIEVLSLRKWAGITDVSMTYLTQLSCLREIDLSQCYQLTSDAVQGLLNANHKLEVLVLADTDRYEDPENDTEPLIDNDLLRCIGRHCPNLVKLHLRLDADTNYADLTAAASEAMIKGLPALTDFVIANYTIPNAILPLLGLYCPLLTTLRVDCVTCADDDFISMCRGCPLIECLDLRFLSNLSDPSMLAVARHCPLLKELSISYLGDLTDDSLCVLFTHCIHLTTVSLTEFWLITDRAILALLRLCPKLRSLTLRDSPSVTDYSIQAIPTYCPGIQSLELECVSTLTRETIIQISRYCKQLHTLLTYKCYKINNNTVVAVLNHAKQLTKLNIYSHNVSVNDEFKAQCDALVAKRRYKTLRLEYSKPGTGYVSSY